MKPRDPAPLGPFPVERGYCRVPCWDGKGRRYVWVKVSPADYGLAMSRRWRLDTHGTPIAFYYDRTQGRSRHVYLHRLVARAPAHLQVDHRRHDLLDCRRSQLRVATPSQNSANTRRHRPHSSAYRGVTKHKGTGRWQAAAKFGPKSHYLGLHETEQEAAVAYDRAARRLWGPFALLNNVKPGRAA